MCDPNPLVAGKGIARLNEAGIKTVIGVEEKRCKHLNRAYIKWITTGLPFVTLKMAITVDGRIASQSGDASWISNERARGIVHHMRNSHDAVMIGVGTLLADDPQLTTRLKKTKTHDCIRIIVDTHLRTPPEARIFSCSSNKPVWICAGKPLDVTKVNQLTNFREQEVKVIGMPIQDSQVDLLALLQHAGSEGLLSLLVEGGSHLATNLILRELVDEIVVFIAPRLLGNTGIPMFGDLGITTMKQALSLEGPKFRRIDDNIMIIGRPARRM